MRNLLGRLHARNMPELVRIADAWGVPLHGESKSDAVSTLYRAMIDPRTMRDLWERLDDSQRDLARYLAAASDTGIAPTLAEIARHLAIAESSAREIALSLYHAGLLAREGDDEPLPVGESPRLLMPREVALSVRRIEDEMAAGNLVQSPLRVLIEFLDDAELEAVARIWGMRILPGVLRRPDLTSRILRLVNDPRGIERVVRGLSRDAGAIWGTVAAAPEPVALDIASRAAGIGGGDRRNRYRLRQALAELEGALLVWHAYAPDGTRWLFIPPEIRHPGSQDARDSHSLPDLEPMETGPGERQAWYSPDAVAWDLLILLRLISGRSALPWLVDEPAPRWLVRLLAQRSWFGHDGLPDGYLELLRELGLAEGVLMVDEQARSPRLIAGPEARAWRERSFPEQTRRLRQRWLRLSSWTEGEPAGIVEVWGADWRHFRPKLAAALEDPAIGLAIDEWVSLQSLAERMVAHVPAILGPSFRAATARLAGEAGAGQTEEEARATALADVIAFELSGPFVWFGMTRISDRAGFPRAVARTALGLSAMSRPRRAADADPEANGDLEEGQGQSTAEYPLTISERGEIALHQPTPNRVWALSAFTELVDHGPVSHFRLVEEAVVQTLGAGVNESQIVSFLRRASGDRLPAAVQARIATWSRPLQRADIQAAFVVRVESARAASSLLDALQTNGWAVQFLDEQTLLAVARQANVPDAEGLRLQEAIRAAGHLPHWPHAVDPAEELTPQESPLGPTTDSPAEPS